MFKCVNKITPEIICDRFIYVDDISQRITRNTDKMMLRLPKCKTEFYRKSFIYTGSEAWNELSLEVKQAQSLTVFKRALQELMI